MRSVKKGKNVNVPLTEKVYKAHRADLAEWLEDAEKNHPTQCVKLRERIARVDTHWPKHLSGEKVVLNPKKAKASKATEVAL